MHIQSFLFVTFRISVTDCNEKRKGRLLENIHRKHDIRKRVTRPVALHDVVLVDVLPVHLASIRTPQDNALVLPFTRQAVADTLATAVLAMGCLWAEQVG